MSVIDELEATLLKIHPSRLKSAILVGDFNINLMSATPHTNPSFLPMRDLACKLNLSQVATEPTRISGDSSSLIDHAYLSDSSILQSCIPYHPSVLLTTTAFLSISISSYLPLSSTNELYGSIRGQILLQPQKSYKTLPVTTPCLTSTLPGQTGNTLFLVLWPNMFPTGMSRSESLYLGSLICSYVCLKSVIDCIERPSPSTLLPPASPLEQPGTRQ